MFDNNLLRSILLIIIFILVTFYILKPKYSRRMNWALFYGFIWLLFSLPIVNYLCVGFGLWIFKEESLLRIPFDLFFIWIFIWLIPFYFFKGRFTIIIALVLFWIDIMIMPVLAKQGVVTLNSNWLIGEVFFIGLVFIPSYLWATYSYYSKNVGLRAIFQLITMILFLCVALPFISLTYQGRDFVFKEVSFLWLQIFFILAFPSLIALIDLVKKGGGTPFPYDKTRRLVTSGVYAYIKNPIQWSFTLLFIPLAVYHKSYLLLAGFVTSIAYTFGVSNFQEFEDMQLRFGQQWLSYKKQVPSWFFLWKPNQYPKAIIYFKKDCNQCEGIKSWFDKRMPLNLEIVYADASIAAKLKQVTYINEFGQTFKSVEAIAYALEHINLAYATLGWFMRFPIINYVLQIIVDAIGFSEDDNCSTKN